MPIGVCATDRDTRSTLADALQQAGYPDVRIVEPNAAPAGGVRAYLVAACDALADGPYGALADRAAGLPLIVVGAQKGPPALRADAWLPAPRPSVVAALLGQLLPAPVPGPSASVPPPSVGMAWRRKADMIIGTSVATRELLHVLNRLAPSSAPVLVTGESGTGKELAARALHYGGPRAREPFVAINCAAIPETLFESELFGYQRGAFTGASTANVGAFEAAHRGTLFLDEVGEIPLPLQSKLLRVLETGEITRLGSVEPRKVSVRIVTATNRRLEAEVQAGRFRADLYYRIRVYPLHLVPLRERPDDIPPIVHHYLSLVAERERRAIPRVTPAALDALRAHAWPGNVRELLNTLERAFLLAERDVIDREHVGSTSAERPAPPAAPVAPAYRDAKARFEEAYWRGALEAAAGNVSVAARLAKKTRKEVYDAIKKLGLDPLDFRTGSGQMRAAGFGAAEEGEHRDAAGTDVT